jgi:hypothetical protein
MIIFDSIPDKWTAIYEPCIYRFKDKTSLGNYDLTFNLGLNVTEITAGAGVVNFSEGQIINFVVSSVNYTAIVDSISGTDVILDRDLAIIGTGIEIFKLSNSNINLDLFVGKIAAGIPLSKLVSIISVPVLGQHEINAAGYLQDYFENIQKPPVLGVDKELFCNYRLGSTALRYGLYGTQSGVNSLPAGSLLRIGALETFAGQGSLFTRLMANSTQNFNL